jgi:hypothetical protein
MSDTIIVNNNISDISVIIDTTGPNLNYISKTNNVINILKENLSLFQSISGSLIETVDEVDTVQNYLSSGWQKTTEYIATGIADGGFF